MTEVTRNRVGVNTYLAPQGPLADPLVLEKLQQEVETSIKNSETQLIIDLHNVPTLNSRVLESLLTWQDELLPKGGSLTIVNANPVNLDVLNITELSSYINIVSRTETEPSCQKPAQQNKRLGDLLLEQQLVTVENIDEALQMQSATGKRLGIILTEKGWVSEGDMLKTLSLQLGMPYIHIRPGIWDVTISNVLAKDIQERLKLLPLFKVHKNLFIATNDPQDLNAFDELRKLTGYTIKPVLAKSEEIVRQFNESMDGDINIDEYLTELEEDFEVVEESLLDDYTAIDEMSSGSPVVNLVNALIQRSIRDGASDIHIE
ncbi:MAG: STAS domain-containing protein, partial [Methylococcales bacterium]|nr:STAS domain-containing protein [Methylococcales bacterium]